MVKKLAVVVRERQEEALRMAVGLTLMDDAVEVYVLGKKLEKSEKNDLNLETLKDMGATVYTDVSGNGGMEYLPTDEIAGRLLACDLVIPY